MSEAQRERVEAPEESGRRELEAVRVCGTCFGLYEEAPSGGRPTPQRCTCRKVEGEAAWPGYDVDEWVRLCACCGQVPLESGSRYSGWFCSRCGERVDEYNREVGRVVVPLGRHSTINGVRPGGEFGPRDGADEVASLIAFVRAAQAATPILERVRLRGMEHNLRELEQASDGACSFRDRHDFGLLEYLDACDDLLMPHEDEAELAAESLVEAFADALVDPESEDAERRQERIDALARSYVASLPAAEIQDALGEGPNAVYRLGFGWACSDGVRQLYPEARGASYGTLLMKLGPVARALADAVAAQVRLVWGDSQAPRLPEASDDLEIWARTELEGDRPRISPKARYVFSTETGGCGTSSSIAYYLTRSTDQTEWRLWAKFQDECTGRDVYCPVAGCRRKGVSMEDAGCLLAQAVLEAMRDAWGDHAPSVGGSGLVTSDQIFAIEARVWPRRA